MQQSPARPPSVVTTGLPADLARTPLEQLDSRNLLLTVQDIKNRFHISDHCPEMHEYTYSHPLG